MISNFEKNNNKKTRKRYPADTMTDADKIDDLVLLANT